MLGLVKKVKLDQGHTGELRVLDSGYTDQVLLDTISEEVLRIKATVCNSLQDLNTEQALHGRPRTLHEYSWSPLLHGIHTAKHEVDQDTPDNLGSETLHSRTSLGHANPKNHQIIPQTTSPSSVQFVSNGKPDDPIDYHDRYQDDQKQCDENVRRIP